MTILGIDPGTGRLGWGVLASSHGQDTLVECGCLESKKNTPLEDRLELIFNFLSELIDKHRPEAIAIEELFFSKNVKTAFDVGAARGVIILAAKLKAVPIFHYNPMEVKSSLTGYGGADKAQIQFMVKNILKLKSSPQPDDAADAVAIALTHAFRHKTAHNS